MDGMADDRLARRNTFILSMAQAVLGAQLPVNFVLGGLAGQMLAPNPCLATLPISMIVGGSMLAAQPLARIMQAHGRRAGFLIGAGGGALGSATVMIALMQSSFALMLLGCF